LLIDNEKVDRETLLFQRLYGLAAMRHVNCAAPRNVIVPNQRRRV
jgi:hypothetical protein